MQKKSIKQRIYPKRLFENDEEVNYFQIIYINLLLVYKHFTFVKTLNAGVCFNKTINEKPINVC